MDQDKTNYPNAITLAGASYSLITPLYPNDVSKRD